MKNSMTYGLYLRLRDIYLNSSSVKIFSRQLSRGFQIFTTSRTFKLLLEEKYLFENSMINRWLHKMLKALKAWLGKKEFIKNILDHSYFTNLFTRIVSHQEKQAINNVYLILAMALVVNMGIKLALGQFTFIGNKSFILIALGCIALYLLQLDYGRILKNSKVVAFAYQILYDQPFNHEK